MAEVILISQFALPYSKIGSWTTLYSNYIENYPHLLDYVICPQPEKLFKSIQYKFVRQNLRFKINSKFFGKSYADYLDPLHEIIKSDQKYIVQIVDNQGIVKPLNDYLIKRGVRKNAYIQYFHHGFSPLYTNQMAGPFFGAIDEMILLTRDSYKFYREYYTALPGRFSILHNGIDNRKFHIVAPATKMAIRDEIGITSKTVFMWCAKDRPKKGLDILLDAWKRVYSQDKNIELLVVGTNRKIDSDGVKVIGTVPNAELPRYYQASDVYLFPTLCKEGFGMTLIEALHCGNYCIASANGGVPEVLQYGKLGKLIDNPNFVGEWVDAIENYLANPVIPTALPDSLYTTTSWNSGMDSIIQNAKLSID